MEKPWGCRHSANGAECAVKTQMHTLSPPAASSRPHRVVPRPVIGKVLVARHDLPKGYKMVRGARCCEYFKVTPATAGPPACCPSPFDSVLLVPDQIYWGERRQWKACRGAPAHAQPALPARRGHILPAWPWLAFRVPLLFFLGGRFAPKCDWLLAATPRFTTGIRRDYALSFRSGGGVIDPVDEAGATLKCATAPAHPRRAPPRAPQAPGLTTRSPTPPYPPPGT